MKTKIQTYQKLRPKLRTGDIVLFSGKGGISAGIKWATLSQWSHIGMILVIPKFDFVTVWESTTLSNVEDLDTGKQRKGVQLVPLSDRVNKYDGDIAVRQLRDVVFTDRDVQRLMELRREISKLPYQKGIIELIKSAYDGPFGLNAEDLSSMFCSELVAEAYQRLGLLDEKTPSNEYTPADFTEEKGLQLLKGSLGPELTIHSI